MLFLDCQYNDSLRKEKILSSYGGFCVSEPDCENKIFKSDDPAKDFEEASFYIAERMQATKITCSMSSSVDNFVRDCDGVFEWYTTASGVEMFDWAEKAREKAAKHKEERIFHSTNVWDLLKLLGVPEDIARNDTVALFHNCSSTTFLALSNYKRKLDDSDTAE